MAEVLNLDKLVPEPIEIELYGQLIKVFPGRLRALIKAQRALLSLRDAGTDPDNQVSLMEELVDSVARFVPDIIEKDLDFTMEQLAELINIAYKASQPVEAPATETAGLAVNPQQGKKV